MQNVFTIYKITNKSYKVKSYIGFTAEKDPYNRFRRHLSDSQSIKCKNYNCLLYKAMRLYGRKNFYFEIIYQSYDKSYTINIMEEYFIKSFNTYMPKGYNMTFGGNGGNSGKRPWSAEARMNFRKKYSGENSVSYKNFRKFYRITYSDGNSIIHHGLGDFARKFGYDLASLDSIRSGKRTKQYKNVIKVELVNI